MNLPSEERAKLAQIVGGQIDEADKMATACERDAATYADRGAEWRKYATALHDSDMSTVLPWLVHTDTVMGLVRTDVERVLTTFRLLDWGTYAALRGQGSEGWNPEVDRG